MMSLELIGHKRFIQSMGLPERVKLVEVGARDGLQNQPQVLALEHKAALINHLSYCGFRAIESGSLVSPKHVPQMADSDRVYQQIQQHQGIDYIMLVPNQKGLERAIACGTKNIAVFCAASDAFSMHNINCTVVESVKRIQAICKQAKANGMAIRGYVSCVLGCPYQGEVDSGTVCQLAAQLYEYGCDEISLGDTIGIGTAGEVLELLTAVKQVIPVENIAVHFHDTYGQALANILAALQAGVHIVDCSVSGLGGCPYATGASGNVASEEVVYMLNGLGIETGINLDELLAASRFIDKALHRQSVSKVSLAMAAQDLRGF